MVAYAFHPSMREVDAQCVLGQLGLDRPLLPPNQQMHDAREHTLIRSVWLCIPLVLCLNLSFMSLPRSWICWGGGDGTHTLEPFFLLPSVVLLHDHLFSAFH